MLTAFKFVHAACLCISPPSWIYSTMLRLWQQLTKKTHPKLQHGSSLLLQKVSDGERAAHNIHWSDGLQRHRGWFQAVCTSVTSVCCPLQPNFGVCIVWSDKIETTFMSMFFWVLLCIRKQTSPNTERYWSVIDIQFPEMLNWDHCGESKSEREPCCTPSPHRPSH